MEQRATHFNKQQRLSLCLEYIQCVSVRAYFCVCAGYMHHVFTDRIMGVMYFIDVYRLITDMAVNTVGSDYIGVIGNQYVNL